MKKVLLVLVVSVFLACNSNDKPEEGNAPASTETQTTDSTTVK